jgi:hypothetical protein
LIILFDGRFFNYVPLVYVTMKNQKGAMVKYRCDFQEGERKKAMPAKAGMAGGIED